MPLLPGEAGGRGEGEAQRSSTASSSRAGAPGRGARRQRGDQAPLRTAVRHAMHLT